MGAGKSAISKILSEKYSFRHLDIDKLKTYFKQWQAGYLYKKYLPVVNEYAKQIVTSNLLITSIIVNKSLGKLVSDEFEDIGNQLRVKVFKIMLWVDLEKSKERTFKRQLSQKLKITQDYTDMVERSWKKSENYKNTDPSLIVIDTTNIEPSDTVEKFLKLIDT